MPEDLQVRDGGLRGSSWWLQRTSDVLKHDMLRRGGDQEAADDEGCQSPVELSEVVWSLDPFLRVER